MNVRYVCCRCKGTVDDLGSRIAWIKVPSSNPATFRALILHMKCVYPNDRLMGRYP